MKILASSFLLLISLACSTPTSQVGQQNLIQTSATGRLIDDIKRDLEGDHNVMHPDCRFSKVISAKPLSKDSEWTKELWTIEACSGKLFIYQVSIQFGQGNNFVMITRTDIK
jgi:hypothetical protein